MTSNLQKRKSAKASDVDATKEQFDNEDEKKKQAVNSPWRHHKMVARLVLVTSVLVIMYYTSQKEKERKFAQFKETIPLRSYKVECSDSYSAEIAQHPNCVPIFCGRFVSDNLVTKREVAALSELARSGFEFGSASGGVAILDLHSGALSKGEGFINLYKVQEAKKIFDLEGFSVYKVVKAKILKSISENFKIDISSIHLTHPTFFSRITNATAKTIHDEYWLPHVDKETYSSFHYTSLLYLTDYSKDFTGGRFIFLDDAEKSNKTKVIVEPKVGRVSMFTSGAENLHFVEKVASGTRLALTVSFTCDKNFAINDPSKEAPSPQV